LSTDVMSVLLTISKLGMGWSPAVNYIAIVILASESAIIIN